MAFPVRAQSRVFCSFEPVTEPTEATRWALEQRQLLERYGFAVTQPQPPVLQQRVTLRRPEEPGLGALNSVQLALAQGVTHPGQWYTYLMTHNISSKTDSCVNYTTNPLLDVCLYNERIISDRNTAAAAGHWYLEMVLGPHPSEEAARRCGEAWVDGTRGKLPKRKKGPFLAQAYNVSVFDCRVRLREPFESYLARNALPLYSAVYSEMKRK